ncbi:hypothetical protein SEA_FUZZBUSTER_13 [Microbacterium phage FuzzBuster]|uniref:Uncharacterized protein n=1 Tax=Microbacterium phage FuzzBuster TaxID=2590935 RepID=A0A516KUZ2_9CAUD|nr:hypothetical protein SEA_FUZZBUSTER_13 [Microbacterium phage FuzzBuster]
MTLPTQAEFEALIIEALRDEGDLMTLGAENGVEIDGHGPSDGGTTPVEGYFTHEGRRHYFSATLSVTLDDFDGFGEGDDDDIDEEE